MPAIATGNGTCKVFSFTGSGYHCEFPTMTATNECSSNVLIGGNGVVRQGDLVGVHNKPPCVPDISVLTSFSTKVFANGKAVAIIGKQYTGDNIIIGGSAKVFVGS